MTVWSASPFLNEKAALEVKLREQAEIVDRFVFAEAAWTFAGTAKPVRLGEGGEWFAWLHSLACELDVDVRVVSVLGEPPPKLVPRQAEAYPFAVDHWRRENWQRACLELGMRDVAPDDIVVLSDVDEIVRPATIRWYESAGLTCVMVPPLPMHVAMIDLRWTRTVPVIARVFRGRALLDGQTCEDVRWVRGMILPPTLAGVDDPLSAYGWHLSYLGGADAIRYKVEEAAHPELVARLSEGTIGAALEGSGDLFGRGLQVERVGPVGWPTCVAADPARWREYLTGVS